MTSPSSDNLPQLIAHARAEGAEAVGDLLNRYRNYLYLLARTQIDLHLSVRASPSDVVQETFLQASRDFEAFRGGDGAQLVAWLRQILVNNIIAAYDRHVRAAKRDLRRERPLEAVAREIDKSSLLVERALASSVEAPEAAATRQDEAAQVADLLAELKPHYREVIILRNLEGRSFKEIAERMGRSPDAVRCVNLFDIETGERIARSPPLPDLVTVCSYTPTGDRLAAICKNGDTHVMHGESLIPLVKLPVQAGWSFHGGFSPDGRRLITGLRALTRIFDAGPIGELERMNVQQLREIVCGPLVGPRTTDDRRETSP